MLTTISVIVSCFAAAISVMAALLITRTMHEIMKTLVPNNGRHRRRPTMQPFVEDDGTVTLNCGNENCDERVTLSQGDIYQFEGMARKFLEHECWISDGIVS